MGKVAPPWVGEVGELIAARRLVADPDGPRMDAVRSQAVGQAPGVDRTAPEVAPRRLFQRRQARTEILGGQTVDPGRLEDRSDVREELDPPARGRLGPSGFFS